MRSVALAQHTMRHIRDPLYLNAYALMASNVLSSGVGLIYWAIAARLYPDAAVGLAVATISLVTFLSGISQLNLRAALLRLVPEAGAAAPRLVGTAYVVTIAAGAVLGLIAFTAMSALDLEPVSALEGVGGLSALSIILLAGATIVWNVFNIQDGVLAGLRRTIWVPVENLIYSVVKLIALVVLAAGANDLGSAAGIVTSWYAPVVVVVVVVTAILAFRWLPAHAAALHDETKRVLVGQRARLLRYVAGDYVASLFSLAVSALLPVLITNTLGFAEGAFFSLAWLVALSLDLLPVNLAASLTVETASGRAHLATETRRALVHALRILVPLALAVALLAPIVLQVFGPTYAARATDLLRLLALGVIPYSIIAICLAVARVRGTYRQLVAIQGSLAVLALGGSALLIGPFGITGVGVAILGARLIVAATLAWKRVLPMLRGAE